MGDITMDVPLHKYWGTCPPCPIGIDAPGSIHFSSDQARPDEMSEVVVTKQTATVEVLLYRIRHDTVPVSYTHLTLPTILRV